jgi:hypothetical protein
MEPKSCFLVDFVIKEVLARCNFVFFYHTPTIILFLIVAVIVRIVVFSNAFYVVRRI